jgi:hypothetical protein
MTHEQRPARFHDLYYSDNYDIIDFESGHWAARSIQGVDATNATWGVGDEAWPAGEELFEGDPVSVAEEDEDGPYCRYCCDYYASNVSSSCQYHPSDTISASEAAFNRYCDNMGNNRR